MPSLKNVHKKEGRTGAADPSGLDSYALFWPAGFPAGLFLLPYSLTLASSSAE